MGKYHDLAMRGNKYPAKAKIIVSTVFVAMIAKETHTTSRKEKYRRYT